MNEPHDPNRTVDEFSVLADSLEAGLAAGFGTPASLPRSSLGEMRSVLLKEAEGESAHIVKPKSDAMPAPEQTGDRYRLDGEIARGGMGVVLRGRDVELGRDLAIKVLLEKYTNRPDVARRFIEEAQIGGQLQHPGVVPVYDIGRFGDRPFFTMKLVKGQTLAMILGQRADPTADRPRLLSIALQVAQTIAYAHAKGVIHRDLKPANIMVGAFGEVQVMDWGLAKVLAEGGVADEVKASRQHNEPEDVTTIRTARSGSAVGNGTDTEAGSLLGTPAYMPPEQANGDVTFLDRRADVFGLGAILCEILTGKPPYVGRSAEEVRRKAANGDLADALTRLETSGADAELIRLTKVCLSPEASDRPRDARAVADTLTAYLNGVQERLRQAELAEAEARARVMEEAKRRRLTLALAATVLLAITLGGGAWMWVKADRDARLAQVMRDGNEALNKATALREQARAANVGSAALFAQAREQAQRANALVESGPADASLLDQVRQLQTELDEEEKDRNLLAALDAARLAQAETRSENGFAYDQAIPLYREALRAYGLPVGEDKPTVVAERIRTRRDVVQETIVATLDEWIDLAISTPGNFAEPHLEWLKAVSGATDSTNDWTRDYRAAQAEKDAASRLLTLKRLATEANVKKVPVRALTRLADQLRRLNDHASAVGLLRRTRHQYPADFWVNHNLGMGLLDVKPPELEEAVRFLTAAVALRPDSPGVYLNLGSALKDKGQLDDAIACTRKAIELNPNYATAYSNLGLGLKDKGQLDKAIGCWRMAIQLDLHNAGAHNNFGVALQEKGQLDEAIACFRDAIKLNPKLAGAYRNLGHALEDKDLLDEAITCYHKGIELNQNDAKAHNMLANAYKTKGMWDDVIACLRKVIELDPKFVGARHNLGIALATKKQWDEAIASFRKAIEFDPKHPFAHCNLGRALKANGQLDDAIASFRKAIELNSNDAGAHKELGSLLCDYKKDYDGAIACFNKAIEIDPNFAVAYNNKGIALQGKQKWDEAAVCFRKAIELDPNDAEPYFNLSNALKAKGQLDDAIHSLRQAIQLEPKHVFAHNNLGLLLARKGQRDQAISYFRKATQLDPNYAHAYLNLGRALEAKGDLDEAIDKYRKGIKLDPKDAKAPIFLEHALKAKGQAQIKLGIELQAKGQLDDAFVCYRKAIELDPTNAEAHNNLGNAHYAKDEFDKAILCYRNAIELEPKKVWPHNNLALAQVRKGQLDEAIANYRKVIELDPTFVPVRTNLARAERLAAARDKLAAYRGGTYTPATTQERLSLAEWCQFKVLPYTAATLFAAAFAADPKAANDEEAHSRYNAACCAALAAAGQGEDAIKLGEKERAHLRKQAFEWLRADLALRTKHLEGAAPVARAAALQVLRHWHKDSDLAGIRDKDALRKLPEDERAAFAKFWADVAALLKITDVPPKP